MVNRRMCENERVKCEGKMEVRVSVRVCVGVGVGCE